MERAYLLHKARHVHTDGLMLTRYPTAPPPPHLRSRMASGLPLPCLVKGGVGQEEGEAERVAVLSYVMGELHADLFLELMEGLRIN